MGYQVAGISMMVIFFGFPLARLAVAFAAWGTFDSCPEALILGGKGDTADEAREHKDSMTISGPLWNVLGVVTAAAYVFALCLACYPCVAHEQDSKASRASTMSMSMQMRYEEEEKKKKEKKK